MYVASRPHCLPQYTALHCTVFYCTVLHCTALYCTVLHCTALYCTELLYSALQVLNSGKPVLPSDVYVYMMRESAEKLLRGLSNDLHAQVLFCSAMLCFAIFCNLLFFCASIYHSALHYTTLYCTILSVYWYTQYTALPR